MNGGGTTPQISGYLEKKAKTGKWQKRWFETNAHFLTYYKTKKMEKLLAALNLPQVSCAWAAPSLFPNSLSIS
jgi:hypothetical protein